MVKKFNLLLILVLKITQIYSEDGFCESQDDCDKVNSKIYDKDSNFYIKQIENALADYIPCSQANCSCHLDVLKRDLLPYKTGITKQMIDDVRDRGTKYQIFDHRLYRQKDCMFPTRCSGIEHFIIPLLGKLPNMDLIINCRDWPQIPNYQKEKGPVLSFSKTKDYADIMYPAWSFWAGGPSISLYPTGLGRWDKHRESITKAAEKFPWERKKEKAFFRGSRTSSERDSLILLSRRMPNLVDAKYTKNQAWKSPADTLNADPAKEISFEDHCKFKYLFNYRGVAASFRFKHLFLCKSLVFHVGDEYDEFFYNSLKPWVHYIPVKSDSTEDDLKKLLEFFKEHDKYAQEIADRGFRHIWENLKMKDIQCYWKKLLLRYGKLIKYDIKLDDDLIEIHK